VVDRSLPAPAVATTRVATPAVAAAPSTTAIFTTVASTVVTTTSTGVAPVTTDPEVVITDPRVFLLGDSVLEATSSDYYDTMEPRLERLGWEPTIDADRGRNTAQAERELRRNRDEVGETVVVLIGHNDPPSAGEYRSRLEDLLDEVEDVPRVLLLTIREFDEEMAPLNAVVRSMPRRHQNVELVEWEGTVADAEGALVRDRLHLTERGAQLLANVVAGALGPAPGADGPLR
jgi:lysophospholipase L1-like esterase